MNPSSAGFDHSLNQFKNIERPAETRFGIRHNRHQPVDVDLATERFRIAAATKLAVGMANLAGAQQRTIDSPNDRRHAVRWIQTLIGIHLTGKIGIRRDLPAAEKNRLETGFHLW